MKKFAIYNKNDERMHQFPVFFYADLAQCVCNRQNGLNHTAGFKVVQIEGGEK